jgi:hypothetical protein
MRIILLLTILLLSSCESNKNKLVKKQQAILQQMEQIKAAYYKTADSLERIQEADSTAAKQQEVAVAITTADNQKNELLIPLQKAYDSLAVELQKQ